LKKCFLEQVFVLELHVAIERVYDEEHDSHVTAPPREYVPNVHGVQLRALLLLENVPLGHSSQSP